jgi:hypothetical protein
MACPLWRTLHIDWRDAPFSRFLPAYTGLTDRSNAAEIEVFNHFQMAHCANFWPHGFVSQKGSVV